MGRERSCLGLECSGEFWFLFRNNAGREVPWSAKQSGAENINKPQRKEQYKVVGKIIPGTQELAAESNLHTRRLRMKRIVSVGGRPPEPPLPPGPVQVGSCQSGRESHHSSAYYKSQHSSAAVYLCLGRLLTSSKHLGAWHTSFNILNNILR